MKLLPQHSDSGAMQGTGLRELNLPLVTRRYQAEWDTRCAGESTDVTRTLSVGRQPPHGLAERFAHIAEQRGMFSYTGLSPQQVAQLRERHSVYMVGTGRANIAGADAALAIEKHEPLRPVAIGVLLSEHTA